MKKVRVTAVSDLHGNLISINKTDILLICGDVTPTYLRGVESQNNWFDNVFIPYLQSLECKYIILIAGNHDLVYFNRKERIADNIYYLEDSSISIPLYEFNIYNGEEIKIYGTPWCRIYGNYPYMIDDGLLRKKLFNIPKDCDILMLHDSPLCVGRGIGSSIAEEAVLESQPRYVFSGHIHTGEHEDKLIGKSIVRNVSLLDDGYNIAYRPYIFNYDRRNK